MYMLQNCLARKKESLAEFFNASQIVSLRFGRVDVRFHEPWSLKEYIIDQFRSYQGLTISQFPCQQIDTDSRIKMLRSLGYKVLADINKASVIMPTSLIGTILLTTNGRGIGFKDLTKRVKWLIQKINESGGRVGTISMEKLDVTNIENLVINGLKVLGNDLVGKEEKGLLEPVYFGKDLFKLSYYRNQVMHLFVAEAIVTVALYTEIKKSNGHSKISKLEVLSTVRFLSSLLSGEFVFENRGLQKNFEQTLNKLQDQGIVRIAEISKDDQLIVEFTSHEEIGQGYEMFDFYCYFIWPFIDGFWLATVSLLC